MKRPENAETPRKKAKGASIFVFLLLGMLVAGLAGFGVTNFGGGVATIGKVGDRTITTSEYALALRSQLNTLSRQVGQPISLQQGLQFGIDAQVRQQLIAQKALDNENDRIGLSAGDARVAAEIVKIPAFHGPTGAFDAETYRLTLQRNRTPVPEFERQVRDDLARSLLTGAVAGGFAAPEGLTDTLFAYVTEQRGFTLLPLTEVDLSAPPPAPDAAQLQTYYTDNIARFTRSEARRITYVALLPAEVAPTIAVDDAALRKVYDERIDEFVQPERRLVERLVFPDEAAAAAAKARIDAGESFDAIVAERGLALTDIDLGDVGKVDLGAAGDAVFALAEPGVVGPFASDLGPALFRMNGVLPAQETTFDEARATLAPEVANEAARRSIANRREAINDALAGGATLEDLAKEQGMTLATLDLRDTSEDAIAGYAAFREAALAAQQGDFPEVIDLDDGGIAALRLDAIVPPEPIPFAEAEPAVTEAWRADALARALAARAEEIKTAVDAGARLGSFGIAQTTARIARDGTVPGAPAKVLETVFALQPGQSAVVDADGFVGVVTLESIVPGDPADSGQAQVRTAIASQVEQALAQDALMLFTNALLAGAGISLDEAAIAAVHSQVQ